MRNYQNIERYLNELLGSIYPQPEDDGHTNLARKVIYHWMSRLTSCENVLDVGAGQGFCQLIFEPMNIQYEGVSLGEDVEIAQSLGRNVKKMDFSFLEYPDESFDLVFSRHSAEHSPFPLLSLMEWHRVSRQWLGLVVPAPDWYGVKNSPNHYYVLTKDQWVNLLENAGWHPIWEEIDELPPNPKVPDTKLPHEIWLFAEKKR